MSSTQLGDFYMYQPNVQLWWFPIPMIRPMTPVKVGPLCCLAMLTVVTGPHVVCLINQYAEQFTITVWYSIESSNLHTLTTTLHSLHAWDDVRGLSDGGRSWLCQGNCRTCAPKVANGEGGFRLGLFADRISRTLNLVSIVFISRILVTLYLIYKSMVYDLCTPGS